MPSRAFQSSGAVSVLPRSNTNQVFAGKDVTRKAVAIWKPEPSYTEEARSRGIGGTVTLKAVFSSTGEVSDIVVVKGSRLFGLAERAIAAAKKMKFLPAEKDGALVSQWIQLEYNFSLH
jgi:TonB family protein